jgi:hypothetical protein
MDPKRGRVVPVDHPDVRPVFEMVLQTIVAESDRGAVLVAASVVDEYLGKLFEGVLPSTTPAKVRKQFLKYPSPFSSMAAKADIALFTRFIPYGIHRTISLLRKLRNDVAHSPESFQLADHINQVRAMSEIGPGVSHFINETAVEILVRDFVSRVLDDNQKEAAEEQFFKTPKDVLDYLRQVPEAMAALQQKSYRMEVGVAAALVCSTLIMRRDEIKASVGEAGLVGASPDKEAA